MSFLLRTVSFSYVKRHLGRTILMLIGMTAGVATFASIQAAERSLIDGFRGTIDRVAGNAQLQITGVGGVPEPIEPLLREVPGVRALSPVIEQVVETAAAPAGSLLLLGVDLVGDHEMRDYGFEGDDPDADDPLLFLARPESVAISRDLARAAGLGKGDPLAIRVGGEDRRLIVRAVLAPGGFAKAFGGAVAVTDVYAAQTMLGRGRRFDRIDVRLEDGTSIDAAVAAIRAGIGPGFDIETPERRGGEMEQLISNFTVGLDLSRGLALGIAVFLVFTTFAVTVARRRGDIGILRALGATPRQVQVLFLAEASLLGAAGGLLGFALGRMLVDRFLGAMAAAVQHNWGLTGPPSAAPETRLVLQCVALGMGAALLGAWAPSAAAGRVRPLEALASGRFMSASRTGSRRYALAGAALVAFAIALARWSPKGWTSGLVAIPLVSGSLGAALLAGPAARLLITLAAPLVRRLTPAAGWLAADGLLGHLRRNVTTTSAVTLALAWLLGLAGYVESNRAALLDWTNAAVTSDLYVRTSTSLAPSTIRFPSNVRTALARIPGVRVVEGTRQQFIRFQGDQVKLVGLDAETLRTRPAREFLAGDPDALVRGLLQGHACAVSANFSRRFGIGLGDHVEIESPEGTLRLPVVAILNGFLSDRGAIIVNRSVFAANWHDDDADIVMVNLAPGASSEAVRQAIAVRLKGTVPALVATRSEFMTEINEALNEFNAMNWVAVMIASGVALVGIVASLLMSVVERAADIAILRALGAVASQIHWSVVGEAVGLSMAGLVVALPLGAMLATFLSTTVSEVYAGFRLPGHYPFELLGRLLLALPLASAAAAWLPARLAVRTKVVDALATR